MNCLRRALTQAWLTRGLLAWTLWPVSVFFTGMVRSRQWLYQQGVFKPQSLPVPVVVVGNVLVGGVGKTPVVMALVQHLKQSGLQVGVLSRGYGRKTRDVREVHASDQPQDVGDEPLLIAKNCAVPIWVGADRVTAAKSLLTHYPNTQVLVCDDGLQHLALARDVELCVFDERQLGNGWLLPAGPLREPWPRAKTPEIAGFELTSSADTTLGEYQVHKKLADYAVRADGSQRSIPQGYPHPVQALAGIAKPHVFFEMLRQQGLRLSHTQALADHADMHGVKIDDIFGELLCTEKDAVKLWPDHPQAWAVPLVTTLPPSLLEAIDACLDRKLSSQHGHQIT